MKIESIIRREGGTTVTVGGVTYRFLPGNDGRHVAEVENESHAAKLLAITEGYRPVVEVAKVPASTTVQPETVDTLAPAAAEPDADDEPEAQSEPEADPYDQKGGPDGNPNTLDREEVARAYQARFGRRPHGKWTAERILAELKAG